MKKTAGTEDDDLSEPLTFPVDAYIPREYAEAEAERLWANVWQHAGRVEDVPEAGDLITYEIADAPSVPAMGRLRLQLEGLNIDQLKVKYRPAAVRSVKRT